MDFREYLERKNLAERGIQRRIRLVDRWLKWLPQSIEKSTYQDLLNYIEKLQKEEKTISHINAVLLGISDYYNYKKLPNLAINTRLKGQVTKVISNPLTAEQLEEIYKTFEGNELEKVILGLMIFQALDKQDIMNLELSDIDLSAGTLRAPGGIRRKNSRVVKLEANQIIPFHDYITEYRGIGRNNKPSQEESEKLFHPNVNKEQRLHEQLKALSKTIKEQNPTLNIKRLTQLKQSRIGIWIDLHGLRKAQYLAGYKDVGNIEKYRNKDMKNLSKQIEMFHPLQ